MALGKVGITEFVNQETIEVTYIKENKSKFTQLMINLAESLWNNLTTVSIANKLARSFK